MKGNFYDYQKNFFEAYNGGRLEEALKIAQEADSIFPDKACKTKYWKACMQGLLGRNEQAVEALEELAASDQWIDAGLLEKEEDLKALRGTSRFEKVVEVLKERGDKAKKASKPVLLEFAPEKSDGVLFALHMKMTGAGEISEYFRETVPTLNKSFVAIQSSQTMGTGLYCWDDMELAKKETSSLIKAYLAKRGFTENDTVIAGASQGGRLAFELVLERILIPRMAIIVVGAFREVEKYREKIGSFPGLCALRFIVGARDPFANETVKLHEMAREKGANSQLKIYENMGHSFPDDFDEYLRKTL